MLRVAEHYAITDTGLQRRANEDSMLARAPLFVVADGMGGAQAGEVASRIAVETFGADGGDFSDPEHALAAHAHEANARIHELSHSDAAHAGMGTTLSAVYVGECDVTIAHVGDSRVYCMRDGELLRLTDDHSLVDELIRQGRLTPEEAEEHPQRSIITRALGPEPMVEVDTRSFKARPDDVYLLCSDGLTSMVGEQRMAQLMTEHHRLRDLGRALINEANSAGGRDNITAVLVRLEEVGVPVSDGPDEHTTVVGIEPSPRPEQQDHEQNELFAHRSDQAATALAERSGHPRAVRRPRTPRPSEGMAKTGSHRPRRHRLRSQVAALTALTVLGLLIAGAYLAIQSVYFIGTDSHGLVAIYRGLPYQLPAGIDLYSLDYVSGVSATQLTPERRRNLLNHEWLTEAKAGERVRELELGQISGG
jgi:protein phosphatase